MNVLAHHSIIIITIIIIVVVRGVHKYIFSYFLLFANTYDEVMHGPHRKRASELWKHSLIIHIISSFIRLACGVL